MTAAWVKRVTRESVGTESSVEPATTEPSVVTDDTTSESGITLILLNKYTFHTAVEFKH